MTKEFIQVVKLFGAAALGIEYNPDTQLDIKKIYEISVKQGVWHTVYLSLSKLIDLSQYDEEFMRAVGLNVSRICNVFEALEQLESNGIECCVLKGCSVARFYAEPACRISGDTDILIGRDNIDKSQAVFQSLGFECQPFVGNMYHYNARHPSCGLIEVHCALYQKHINDVLFKNLLSFNEPFMEIDINGYKVKVLGINDGVNHLTAHYIKHFITRGAGIRQLMDMLLYMEHYEKEIDWDRYNKIWKEIGFYELIEVLKGIGVKYWGFEFESYSPENADAVLADIEEGGVFGFDKTGRLEFLNVYLNEISHDKKYLENYMNKVAVRPLWLKIFPEAEYLAEAGYPYALNGGWNVQRARIKRIIDIIIKSFRRERDIKKEIRFKIKEAETEEEIARMELLKNIGVLDLDKKNRK